ncbi:MAG: cupin domain-containing protein [Deltaproteobacteria bacterium]|nr:cupin domain-containing protein [Deltaproteobacteria bacterium]
MSRPPAVVHVWDVAAEPRPRFFQAPGVQSAVRNLGDAVGLTHMGLHLRRIEPGHAGTHRHYHLVEEEWVYVLSGWGHLRIGAHRVAVGPGSFAGFPAGPRPHHFLADGDEPLVLLEGGERRPREDEGVYVDLGKRWRAREFSDVEGPLPMQAGDVSQVISIEQLEPREFQHAVDPDAGRLMRRLDRPTGLQRQAVVWSHTEHRRSTAFHTHTRTDEWVLILAGRARLRLGDDHCVLAPFDLVGHPAGSAPHLMQPLEPLTYLMGGERDAEDVVLYPEAGTQLVGGRLVPL